MLELLARGGIIMIPLGITSMVALAVVLERLWTIGRAVRADRDVVEKVHGLIKAKQLSEAYVVLQEASGPIGLVLKETLRSLGSGQARERASRIASRQIRHLEAYLKTLGVIGSISPLIGLLGTVIGLLNVFQRIEGAGARVDPSMLAGGIWQALITTVTGLCIAVPAVLMYHWFISRIDGIEAEMKELTEEVLDVEGALQNADQAA